MEWNAAKAVTRLRSYREDVALVDFPVEEVLDGGDIHTRRTPPPPYKVVPYDDEALIRLLMTSLAQRAGVLSQPGLHVWQVTVAYKAAVYAKPMKESIKRDKGDTIPAGLYTFVLAKSPAATHDEVLIELHRIGIPIVQRVNGAVIPLPQLLILTKRED